MSVGHSHSHRRRLPTHGRRDRRRDIDLLLIWDPASRQRVAQRVQRRIARIERRRAELAAGPREVVVRLDTHGAGEGMHGQRSGRLYVRPPEAGQPSRFVFEALERQEREAAEAIIRGR